MLPLFGNCPWNGGAGPHLFPDDPLAFGGMAPAAAEDIPNTGCPPLAIDEEKNGEGPYFCEDKLVDREFGGLPDIPLADGTAFAPAGPAPPNG